MNFWKSWFIALASSIALTGAANEIGHREYLREKEIVNRAYKTVSAGYVRRAVFYHDGYGGVLLEKGDEVELVGEVRDSDEKGQLRVIVKKFTDYEARLDPKLLEFPYRYADIREAVYLNPNNLLRASRHVFTALNSCPSLEDIRLGAIKHRDRGKGHSEFTPFLLDELFQETDTFRTKKILDVIFSIRDPEAFPRLLEFGDERFSDEIFEYARQFSSARR